MKIRDMKNITIIVYMTILCIVYKTVIIPSYLDYEGLSISFFMIIASFLSILLLGYRKEKKSYKRKKISYIIIYETVICFLVMYGLGFVLGFLKNSYLLEFKEILLNIINPFIFVITSELIRNVVIKANKDKKIVIVIITILLLILDMLTSISIYNFKSPTGIFIFLTMSLLPLITKHFMLSYVTYYASIKECLLYRLIVDLYIYVVPIMTDLGDYLTCLINIIYPYIIYSSVSKVINRREPIEHDFNVKRLDVIDVLFSFLIIFMALLISGDIGLKMVSIGSESMNPAINKGDIVIVKTINNTLKENDIISFNHNDINIVHRIVKIEEVDGEVIYHTKGDANEVNDNYEITEDAIVGKVLFNMPYIGYPSIWLNEYRS